MEGNACMKVIRFTVILSVLLLTSGVFAGLYSWTDENGVKHFSDSPPDGQDQQQIEVKHEETPDYPFSHYLYRIKKGFGYCGDRRLPSDKEEDPRLKLINILSSYKGTRKLKKRYEEDLAGLRERETRATLNANVSGNYASGIERVREDIAECECLMLWMEGQVKQLGPMREQIIKEARQAEYEYNEILNRCGPEPKRGIHTDKETIEWAKCKSRILKLHNQQLRRLKTKMSLEQSLKQALQPD
jgi:hypothetical protein